MFRSLLVLLLLASPAEAAISRFFSCQGVDCSTVSCLADDSLTVESGCSISATGTGTIAATTADALSANPSDCSANQYAHTIAADGDLTCSAVDFSQVAAGTNAAALVCGASCSLTPSGGTITANDTTCADDELLDGVGDCIATSAIGVTDHGGLTGLTDDDHTQYLLLAGRSGGQSAYGGTASGNDLTLTPNSAATDGALNLDGFIDIFTSAPDIATTGSLSWINVEPDVDLETAGILRFAGYRFAPTIHLGQATAVVPVVIGFRGQGTITIDESNATPTAPNYQFFDSEWTNTSSVAGVPPVPGEVFVDATTYEYTAATTTATMSSNAPGSFDAKQVYKSTGTGTFAITGTDLASFISEPTVTATNASGNVNITQFNHLYIAGLTQTGGGGTETVTTEIGVHVDNLNADTTNIGIKNDFSTVFTPTAQVVAATTTLTSGVIPTTVTLCVGTCGNTTSTLTWTGTASTLITDGTSGQMIVLSNGDAADAITMTNGNNVSLCGAANYTIGVGESVMLFYVAQTGLWSMVCGNA